MDDEVEHTMRDLRLGIAGGMNVKKRQQFYIDNRFGAGQFSINSLGSTQSVGRDQTATTTEYSSIVQVLTDVRLEAARAGLSPEDRDAIEDAVLAAEREIAEPQPDQGRVKRLVLAVGKVARDLGVSVASQAITTYAKSMGWL